MHIARISFPEIRLQTRDAHKLRGYFGDLFREHSPLLHNHLADGSSAYRYPLVQYKVLDHVPVLVGLAEGAELLIALFLKIKELHLGDRNFPILAKHIESIVYTPQFCDTPQYYCFDTLWMALNQDNYRQYIALPDSERRHLLNRLLISNILSFFKGVAFRAEYEIEVKGNFEPHQTLFKNQPMIAFSGHFQTNVHLPAWVGIGKAVSRGFGALALQTQPSQTQQTRSWNYSSTPTERTSM